MNDPAQFLPNWPQEIVRVTGTLLPRSFKLNVDRPGHPLLCGITCISIQLLAGISGPLLDVFFVHSQMDRKGVVATKAIGQAFGHVLKVFYFGVLLATNQGAIEWWLAGACVVLAVFGTTLSRRVLEEDYILQIALLDPGARDEVEKAFVAPFFDVDHGGLIPTMDDFRDVPLLEVRPPDVARYFVRVKPSVLSRFAEEKKRYLERQFHGLYEAVGMTGNLAMLGGAPALHCHLVIGDRSLKTHAGHLVRGAAGGTLEVVLRTTRPLRRARDAQTGLNVIL